MKDYEIIYSNLFYKIEKPNIKVLDVLIKVDGVYNTLRVNVNYQGKDSSNKWDITGDSKIVEFIEDDLETFLDKLKEVGPYYMSDDDNYEIIGISRLSFNSTDIIVAVAYAGGHFATVKMSIDNHMLYHENIHVFDFRDFNPDADEFFDKVLQYLKQE